MLSTLSLDSSLLGHKLVNQAIHISCVDELITGLFREQRGDTKDGEEMSTAITKLAH